MIKNVIMDMGNVLLDYNPQVVMDKYIENPEDKKIISAELFNGNEWRQKDLGLITDMEMYQKVKKRVPENLHKALLNCVNEWSICMVPVNGARKFTDYVKEKGYDIYVLSNASEKFYDYFPNFAPFEYFKGIMVSCDVHMVKPDVNIYKRFLEEFSLKADECIFIDDREENVAGAIEAGINGVVFKENFDEIVQKILTSGEKIC